MFNVGSDNTWPLNLELWLFVPPKPYSCTSGSACVRSLSFTRKLATYKRTHWTENDSLHYARKNCDWPCREGNHTAVDHGQGSDRQGNTSLRSHSRFVEGPLIKIRRCALTVLYRSYQIVHGEHENLQSCWPSLHHVWYRLSVSTSKIGRNCCLYQVRKTPHLRYNLSSRYP